jgi:hypothetical protein
MEISPAMCALLFPDYDLEDPQPYPGDIQPGEYRGNEVVEVLRQRSVNSEAIRFVADVLEE